MACILRRICAPTALILALCSLAPTTTAATQNVAPRPSLTLSASRPTLRPGAVVLITATSSKAIVRMECEAFDRKWPVWPADEAAGDWQMLVAVPIEVAPGTIAVHVRTTHADGGAGEQQMSLTVEAGRFATRRLTVDPDLVKPPASAAARIERESQALAAVFKQPSSTRHWKGSFSPPVPGTPTSSFGVQSIFNGQPRGRHLGTDFRAAVGVPLRAPNAGVVVLTADRYFSGQTVVVDHGQGLFSLFAHLSRIAVATGDVVSRGALLGETGATGRVTGPHLHWAVRLRDESVDPLSLLDALGTLRD